MPRTSRLDVARHSPCRRLALSPAKNSSGSPKCSSTSMRAFAEQRRQMRHKIGCRRSRRRAGGAGGPSACRGARIGDGHGLDVDLVDRPPASRHGGGAEQRALERQEHVAVAGGAFGEKHDGFAGGQARAISLGLRAGRAPALALDEDGALQRASQPNTGQPAMSDLAMKETSQQRADHRDVGPGDVVGGDHQRRAWASVRPAGGCGSRAPGQLTRCQRRGRRPGSHQPGLQRSNCSGTTDQRQPRRSGSRAQYRSARSQADHFELVGPSPSRHGASEDRAA